MNPEEHKRLSAVARDHWYYKGKRAIVKAWLRARPCLESSPLLVDVGAGQGLLIREMSVVMRALGVEPYREVIPKSSPDVPWERMLCGSVSGLPVKDKTADYVTCLDVLEHICDDRKALAEIVRVTKEGGRIILTVPACSWALSDWDQALGHYRRYNRRDMEKLLGGFPLDIIENRYINNVPFLPVVAYRFLRQRFFPDIKRRLEDEIPSEPWNSWLYQLFVKTALWQSISLPFGLSLLTVAERR